MRFAAIALSVVWLLAVQGTAQSTGTSAVNGAAPADAIGPPAHPATQEQIREYMSLAGTARTAHTLMAQQIKAMRATAVPYLPASFWDDLETEFQKIDIVTAAVPIYQRCLSTEDMAQIIAFYRSPPGKRILATQLPITRDSQAALAEVGRQIGERVYAKHKDEIETAKKNYEQQHPGAPEIQIPK